MGKDLKYVVPAYLKVLLPQDGAVIVESASRGRVVSTRNLITNVNGWIDLGDYKGTKLNFFV